MLVGSASDLAPSSKAPGIAATALKRAGVTTVSSNGAMNSSNWPSGGIDTGKHYAFSVTPPPGCTMTLTALSIDLKASATGPTMAAVGTSVDGYAALQSVAVTTVGGAVTVPLAGISGGAGTTIEVHVFGFDAGASGGTLRIDDLLSLAGSIGAS